MKDGKSRRCPGGLTRKTGLVSTGRECLRNYPAPGLAEPQRTEWLSEPQSAPT